MEGTPEHRWVQDEKWDSLRSYIWASCVLELNKIATDIIISTQAEYITAGLCSGIPTGTSQEGTIHENSQNVVVIQ